VAVRLVAREPVVAARLDLPAAEAGAREPVDVLPVALVPAALPAVVLVRAGRPAAVEPGVLGRPSLEVARDAPELLPLPERGRGEAEVFPAM